MRFTLWKPIKDHYVSLFKDFSLCEIILQALLNFKNPEMFSMKINCDIIHQVL